MSVAEWVDRIPSADRALGAMGVQRVAEVSRTARLRLLGAFGLGLALGAAIAIWMSAAASSDGEESRDPSAPEA